MFCVVSCMMSLNVYLEIVLVENVGWYADTKQVADSIVVVH